MSLKAIKQATSLSALSAALRHTANTLKTDVNTIAINASDSLIFELIYKTPVDTSLALSNWQIGLVVPEMDYVPAYAVGESGSTASQSRSAAYAAARAALVSKKPSTRVFISNNAKHIVELNQGKSSQQPTPYWIQVTEAKVDAQAQAKLKALIDGN